MAKQILPWFGGSAAVWTTCLVFFQTTLLAGYAYSDLAVHRLAPRAQVRLHVALLVVSLVVLPIVPGARWKPAGSENPSWLILGLLAVTIGLPYFLLSTTSPLVQAWFARARPGASPYRLFALSNLASMLALVGYPFLLEPWAPTRAQAWGWSAAYALFVVLCAAAGWASLPRRARAGDRSTSPHARTPRSAMVATRRRRRRRGSSCGARSRRPARSCCSRCRTTSRRTSPRCRCCGSCRSRSTCSRSSSASTRRAGTGANAFLPMVAAALGVMAWTLADPKLTHELALQIGVFCAGLFIACMFCHGELVRLEARAALPHALLPDDLAGRRRRRGAGRDRRAARAAGVLRARAAASSAASLLLAWQVRRMHPVFRVARRRRRCSRRSADRRLVGARVLRRRDRLDAQLLRRAARAGVGPGRARGASPLADPRHDPARHSSTRRRTSRASADDLLHADLGHRPAARVAAPAQGPAQGRRDRPRHRHDRHVRREGRHLPLLRHQSGRDRSAQRDFTYLARQRRDDRARAGRRAALARARADAEFRRARDRRVLERRDPGAPHHLGGARRSTCGT